jgi:hypothetical protein
MPAAALLDGTDRRRIEIAASNRLGVALDNALQTSNWGAANLTAAQIEYAGLDAENQPVKTSVQSYKSPSIVRIWLSRISWKAGVSSGARSSAPLMPRWWPSR